MNPDKSVKIQNHSQSHSSNLKEAFVEIEIEKDKNIKNGELNDKQQKGK